MRVGGPIAPSPGAISAPLKDVPKDKEKPS